MTDSVAGGGGRLSESSSLSEHQNTRNTEGLDHHSQQEPRPSGRKVTTTIKRKRRIVQRCNSALSCWDSSSIADYDDYYDTTMVVKDTGSDQDDDPGFWCRWKCDLLSSETKRRLTYVTIGLFFFLAGVEYAIILPTVWLYLRDRFDATPTMLGLVMTAFYASGLVSAPIMGWWSDVSGSTKTVLLFGNLWIIGGSFMYFMGINEWFLFGARLVAGVGTGAQAALFADVTRLTTDQDRTSMMAMFLAAREIGTMTGPACDLFLRQCDFSIAGFAVDKYSAPGIFMAFVFTLYEIFVLFFFWNVTSIIGQESKHIVKGFQDQKISGKPQMSNNQYIEDTGKIPLDDLSESQPPDYGTVDDTDISRFMPKDTEQETFDGYLEYEEPKDVISLDHNDKEYLVDDNITKDQEDAKTNEAAAAAQNTESQKITWDYFKQEYIRDEVIALLFSIFAVCFSEMAVETMLTPMSSRLMGWADLENSLLFAGAGLQLLVMFAIIFVLSNYLTDRVLASIGVFFGVLSALTFLIFVPLADNNEPRRNTAPFILAVMFVLICLPLVLSSSVSLYSKITRKETQGFSQGLQRMFNGMASILGPLWTGGALHMPIPMLSVQAGVQVLSLAMILISFKKLVPLEQ